MTGTPDLYQVLGLEKTADSASIKKAYHKAALACHPDKNPDEGATERFQCVQKAFSVLNNERSRREYDATGQLPEDFGGSFDGMDGDELYSYFRDLYHKVTDEDVAAYRVKYRFLDAEREDLDEFYEKKGGDLEHILDFIPYAEPEDLDRYRHYFTLCVQSGTLELYPAFKKWKVSKPDKGLWERCRQNENRCADEEQASTVRKPRQGSKSSKGKKQGKGSGCSDEMDLASLILQRKHARQQSFNSLLAKYGGADAGSPPDIDDEAFEATRRRLEKGRASNRGKMGVRKSNGNRGGM